MKIKTDKPKEDNAVTDKLYNRLYGDDKLSKTISNYLLILIFSTTISSIIRLLSKERELLSNAVLIVVLHAFFILMLGLEYVHYSNSKNTKKTDKQKKLIIISLGTVEVLLATTVCEFVFQLVTWSIVFKTYEGLVGLGNVLAFILLLGVFCYFRFKYREYKNGFYMVFFVLYCISVIYAFLPGYVQASIWNHALSKTLEYRDLFILLIDGMIFPAVKEAGLAFIILDTIIKTD